MRKTWPVLAVLALACLLAPATVRAQNVLDSHASQNQLSSMLRATAVEPQARQLVVPPWQPSAPSRTPLPLPRRSALRKVAGGLIGGFGGFYSGALIGAGIEGNSCRCDDPGLTGALIGAPIGAVAGSILGVWLASR